MGEIVTERLRLRPFQAGDLAAFVAYRREPEVARYQSWDTTFSLADAERFLVSQEGVKFGAPGVWVQLAAIDRLSGTLCGDCGVCVVADQPATAEVGVTLAPDSQGSG
ncbi:MAG: GNAT family protein, partial [Solirubrobacteraceae bacterium]